MFRFSEPTFGDLATRAKNRNFKAPVIEDRYKKLWKLTEYRKIDELIKRRKWRREDQLLTLANTLSMGHTMNALWLIEEYM